MKVPLYNLAGEKKKEIELPQVFATKMREDLILKCYEVERYASQQAYGPNPESGKRHSASGTISHRRHEWGGHYGKGISRVPRKTMWRRGTQFFWVGAEIASARGGRRAHPPQFHAIGKINQKEKKLAFSAALAGTTESKYILARYESLKKLSLQFPLVIESPPEKIKTKDFMKTLKKILGDAASLAFKNHEVRAGRGKTRGRKYKSSAGLLLITSSKEKIKVQGIDVKTTSSLSMSDLYPLGRITMFTEKSLEELK